MNDMNDLYAPPPESPRETAHGADLASAPQGERPQESPAESPASAPAKTTAEAPTAAPLGTPIGDAAVHMAARRGGHFEATSRTFSRLGLGFILLTVGTEVGVYLLRFLLTNFYPQALGTWWISWVGSILPLYGVGLPLMLLFFMRVPKAPHNTTCTVGLVRCEKPPFRKGDWFALLCVSIGAMYAGAMVSNILMNILSIVTGYAYQNGLDSMVGESPLWMTLFGTCVVAPIGEEFIFRKLFIDRARRYGDTAAILLSGVVFGLFHGNLYQCIYAAMFGIILAYIYTRTNNLWLCVLMHGAVNLVCGVLISELSQLIPEEAEGIMALLRISLNLFLAAFTYGMIALGVVLFISRLKRRALSPDPDLRTPRYVVRDAVLNPGMMANLILLAALILYGLVMPLVQFYIAA